MTTEELETSARIEPESAPPTWRVEDLAGEDYRACLAQIHDLRRPKTYLEIGTFHGDSLRLARCAAIALDPHFQLEGRFPTESMPSLCLFQMRSDSFFATHDPRAILGGPIDLAFLDGMHLFECLLRDFMHTERSCQRESIILMHDCVPMDLHMAGRDVNDGKRRSLSAHPNWWTGDVWKILPILAQYRPDLSVEVFNATPTGLVIVRGLDPDSRSLNDHYDEIIQEFRKPADEAGLFAKAFAGAALHDTSRLIGSLSRVQESGR